MAITLPYTFVSGGTRSGSEVNANLEAVRKWMNGAIPTADLAAQAADYQHFMKPEHYGSPLKGSLGTTQDVYGRAATDDKAQRGVFTELFSGTDYVPIPELSATIYVERSAKLKVAARYYVWSAPVVVAPVLSILGVVAFTRLFVGGSGKPSTARRVAVHNDSSAYIAADDKNECSFIYSEQLAAGEYDVSVGLRCLQHTAAAPVSPINDSLTAGWVGSNNSLVYVEARSFVVKVINL